MENSKKTRIDQQGNIKLSHTMQVRLGWNIGTTLAATLDPTSGEVVLSKAEDNAATDVTVVMDELGRIALPKQQRTKLGWQYVDAGDKIELTLCMWTQTITLRLYEKHKLICTFCRRPASVVKIEEINDKCICDYCIDAVC